MHAMHSSGFFRIKLIAKLILKREISGSHTISDQSLSLSTIVLNDKLNDNYYGASFVVYNDLLFVSVLKMPVCVVSIEQVDISYNKYV